MMRVDLDAKVRTRDGEAAGPWTMGHMPSALLRQSHAASYIAKSFMCRGASGPTTLLSDRIPASSSAFD